MKGFTISGGVNAISTLGGWTGLTEDVNDIFMSGG